MINNEQMPSNPENKAEIVKANMNLWLEKVKSTNVADVASMYSDDSFFLPTVSGDFKKGQSGVEDYFNHFLAKNPEGNVLESEVTWMSDNAYVEAGMYNFELDGEEGREVLEARFTYLWRKNEKGVWQIVHHHSSLKPCGK